jgi:predicted negative regulator of RcsB-dependent stress response
MRATLADASLARYAGRFVWLELDFDKPANQGFLVRHGVTYTPSLFVLDPKNDRATASQLGGMTVPELTQFLDRGERGVLGNSNTPADAALSRGDEMLGQGRRLEAIAAYREALHLGDMTWPERGRAASSLTWALSSNSDWRSCAETAATESLQMSRGQMFGRVVLSGLACANQGESASWAQSARKTLEPLAEEAIALTEILRDHRFQLYQQLMYSAELRGDKATVAHWGDVWIKELDATQPANDDERSALDVARVDAASAMSDPARVLAALIASEKAMPKNYNASLRLAQMETEAKRYDDAIDACDRGLKHVSGPIGRTWLLQTKADALVRKGDRATARHVLEDALRSAKTIGLKQTRDRNVARISKLMEEAAR